MSETDYRYAGVRITRELENQARENSKLGPIPLGALVRIALARLAGYEPSEAFDRFFLDPTSKRAREIQKTRDDTDNSE